MPLFFYFSLNPAGILPIQSRDKGEILSNIYKKLAKKGNKSFEIVLTSEEKFKSAREYVGTLSYEVDKEGILIWG